MPASDNGALLLYYYPYSFYSQKVVMALHQMKIKFKPKVIDIHRGKQFTGTFLSLNPKGEVPVLVDDVRVIPDSEKIIDYLEDNFSNGNSGLLPKDRELRARVLHFHQSLHELKIEALGFGAAMFDDLGIHPKAPYNCLTSRMRLRDYLQQRPRILETEAAKHPMYSDILLKKLEEVREESKIWENRDNYEGLLIQFERVLDECEAELTSHDNPGWWLCSQDISVADIDLALILYRLWQLGFERRMWERNRPNLRRYYARLQNVESFKKAITMNEGFPLIDFLTSPVFLGLIGSTVIVAGGYYLWTKKGAEITAALASIFGEDGSATKAVSNSVSGGSGGGGGGVIGDQNVRVATLPRIPRPPGTIRGGGGGTKPHQFM